MKTVKDLEITVTDFGSDSAIKVGSKTPLRLSTQALDFLCTAICDMDDAEDVCLTQDEAVVSISWSKKEGSLPTLFIKKDGRNVLVTRDIDELTAAIGRDREERHKVAHQVLDELASKRNGKAKVPSIPVLLKQQGNDILVVGGENDGLIVSASIPDLLRQEERLQDNEDFREFVLSICEVADNLKLACQSMLTALR